MFRSFRTTLSLALAFLFLALCPFAASSAETAFSPTNGPVSGPQGHALITSLGAKLLVLDVRTPEEFNQGHVPGALLIPVQELKNRLGEIPADRPVLVVCRTGRRAQAAYDILAEASPRLLETGLWYLAATPEYKADGTFVFP